MSHPFYRATFAALTSALLLAFVSSPSQTSAQQTAQTGGQEIVVNLAAGRVVIAVVKDAIVIGTVENPIEAETHPPTPVEMGTDRAGVILGSVDWFSPSSHQYLAMLDQELPHLRSRLVATPPHLGQSEGGDEASDIEATGLGLLDRLSQVAKGLHGKVNLPDDEPIAELIIVDYFGGYGPEVWRLSYAMKQEQENDDYWETRVLRPAYVQFWPPEKGQPRTLIEFDYPPENTPTALIELLRQKDPRLEGIRSSDAEMAQVADEFLRGESNKVRAADAIQFLRAALSAIAPSSARQTMAVIGEQTGFAWVLPPPAEAEPQHAQQGEESERPEGAPSLFKH
ncbi:MAG TPA: hypothetical protein VNE63_20800 [Candidatus Acidoferrales bacterium]|nr:hypothetical protein [Candidatus Acidoferrales bacterium]